MDKNQSSSYVFWTWVVALILALILAWALITGAGANSACCHTEETTAAAKPNEENMPPSVVTEAFSFSASADHFDSSGDASNIAWFNHTEALKGLLNGNLQLTGDDHLVVLSGLANSEEEKQQKGLDTQTFFGPNVSVDNQITVEVAAVPLAKVYFESGYHQLPADGSSALEASIAFLKDNPSQKAIISGYHDSTGDFEMNQALAKKRAQSVYDALVLAGISVDNIEMRKPVSTNGDGSLNEARRVEVAIE